MTVNYTRILILVAGSLLVNLLSHPAAEAAIVRRAFQVNAGVDYTGSGFVDYDDATLTPTGDPSGNQFAAILNAVFGYTGDSPQTVNDPLSGVNFDSLGNFLGIDLEIPGVAPRNSLLIANEHVYNPNLISNAVTYRVDTAPAIPTPALLPGLIAFGLGTLRRQQQQQQQQQH